MVRRMARLLLLGRGGGRYALGLPPEFKAAMGVARDGTEDIGDSRAGVVFVMSMAQSLSRCKGRVVP